MNTKRDAAVTVLFLCAIMLAFTLADLWNDDRKFSENENRLLASRPELEKEAVMDGSYMEDYEKYVTDQFVSRDTWIMLKTRTDILLQKKDINGVYLGREGYLLEKHLEKDIPPEKVEKKIALLKRLVEDYHARVMLIPTADNIITDKLPANAQYYREELLLEKLRKAVGDPYVIDVFPILREHAEEELYYRTDHHWTSLGAYYGYMAWAEKMRKFPFPYQIDTMETVTDSFLGTLHSRLNLPMEGEAVRIFPETKRYPVTLTYDFARKTHSFYEEAYLDTKNKYGYFLDDNHPFIEIETDFHNGQELFLIKDSFANCLIPLLAPHYEKIYVVDLRYYNGSLYGLIDNYRTERRMDVLVLYDYIHFINDFQYY